MSVDYTSTGLIAQVKRLASVPTNQSLFDETAFLEFLSDEMLTEMVPQILSCRENYFETYTDYPVVSGTDRYIIPRRAIGDKLKNVVWVNSDGTESHCPKLTDKDIEEADAYWLAGHFIRGNYIHLHPNAAAFPGMTLRAKYYRRPNRLVKTSQAGQVVSILGNVVTLSSAPTTWTTATILDAIKGKPGFESLGDDLTITLIAGFDLTFATVPTGLEAGDWIAEAGESPIPQIPYEMHGTLAQKGAAKIMEALGSQAGLQAAQAKLQIKEQRALTLLTPRVDEKPKRVVSRRGIWRSGGRQRWPR